MGFSLSLRICGARKYGLTAVRHYHSLNHHYPRLLSHHRLFSGSVPRLGAIKPEIGETFPPTPTFVSGAADGVLVSDGADKACEAVDMASLGLGGYWPPGMIQNILEVLYNHAHLPWWGSIIALTFLLRLSVVPVAVKMQVVSAKLAGINPDAKVIHAKIQEFKMSGDTVNQAKAGVEMMELYRKHGVHPLIMIPLAFAQLPIFLSMFRGIRGMTDLPMEHLKTGGQLWFVDLTVPDPLFLLPLLACLSFLANIQLGGEGGAVEENDLSKRVRWILRGGSILILPLTIKFPAAVLLYWVSNSTFSMLQILVFKSHAVKRFFGIPIVKRK